MVGTKATGDHTPGHMSLYFEKEKMIFSTDSLFKSVMGIDGLSVAPSQVSIDPATCLMNKIA
jgi:glyoxylase-like metal-dependent hydrolase (beta-lactamase superfamily II)